MRKAAGAFLLVLTLSPAAPAQSDTFAVVAPYVVVLSQTHAGRTSRGTGWIGGSVKRCVLCHQAATSWVASTPSTYRTPA